jgi:hypothetical protein
MKKLLVLCFLVSVSTYANCIKDICVGKVVADSGDKIGRVTSIKDSTINYKVGSYAYSGTYSTLSGEVDVLASGAKKGKVVVDSLNRIGRALYVFTNNKVYYKSGHYTYVSKKISIEVDILESGAKKDKVVLDNSNRIGRVLYVFANNKVYYKSGSYTYVNQNVSVKTEVLDSGASTGKVVLDSSNRIGRIIYVFANKKVYYKSGSYTYVNNDISVEVEQTKAAISKNSVVLDNSNRVGRVIYVFANQKVYYKSGSYTYVNSHVSNETTKIGKIKKDTYIVDGSNRIGKVLYVFANKKAYYKSGSYTYINSNISAEVDTHAEYDKKTFYATSNYNASKVIKFFENGKVYTKSVDGYTNVSSTLYKQVDELQNYRAGVNVLNAAEQSVEIKLVFENGAALLTSIGDDEKEVLSSAKIFGIDNKTRDKDLEEWVRGLNDFIKYDGRFTSSGLVINSQEYEAFKIELIEFLETNPDIVYNKKDQQAVADFLTKSISIEPIVTDPPIIDPPVTIDPVKDKPVVTNPYADKTIYVSVRKKKYRDLISDYLVKATKRGISIVRKERTSGDYINVEIKRNPIRCFVRLTQSASLNADNKRATIVRELITLFATKKKCRVQLVKALSSLDF